jgi:hypothetical protein
MQGNVMEWIEQLLLMAFAVIILATIVFALIGIHSVYSRHKEAKWQRKYGDKLEKDTERNMWKSMERLSDRVFLLEEIIKKHSIENGIDIIDRIISEVDYDERYGTWKKTDSKWTVYALSSMSGGLGSTDKAQAEVNEDFNEYELQKKRQLKEKLNKATKTDK